MSIIVKFVFKKILIGINHPSWKELKSVHGSFQVPLNSCGPVQIWLSANRPPNISVLLQTGINDQAAHWSHGRRGSITPKEKPSLYFCLLHLSLVSILLRRAQVSGTPFLDVHGCTLLVGLCVYLCVCACLSELLCFKASARGRKGVLLPMQQATIGHREA